LADTALVVIVKFLDVVPAATVTVAEVDESVVSLLVMVTTSPPGPAGPVRVTVPVALDPPTTDVGRTTTLNTVGS
jgi:hypothetical protein